MGTVCSTGTTEVSKPKKMKKLGELCSDLNKHILQIDNIKILTYNIFCRPPGIHNNGNDYKSERLDEFLNHIHSYDIVCLQEIFGVYSNRRSKFIKKAKQKGFLYTATSSKTTTLSSHFIDGGLLILSRYPILATEFCQYPLGLGVDYLVKKGALYTKISIGNSYLHLYTTHSQAKYSGIETKCFYKRMEQFIKLQEFMKSTLEKHRYQEEDLVLVTGDFNVNARDDQRLNLQKKLPKKSLKKLIPMFENQSFSEYEALISVLSDNKRDEIQDLVLQKYKEHPITFGDYVVNDDNEKVPIDTVLTGKWDQCTAESLDYIFRYVPKWQTQISQQQSANNPNHMDELCPPDTVKSSLSVIEESANVEKLEVKGLPFNILSDHYGISVMLQYQGKSGNFDKEELDALATQVGSNPFLSPYKAEELNSVNLVVRM